MRPSTSTSHIWTPARGWCSGGAAEAYAEHVQLPFVFRTAQGVEVIETKSDLHGDISQLHEWLASQGVTDYHRIARTARYLDADTIEGFHVTYALRGATPRGGPLCQPDDPEAGRDHLEDVLCRT